MYRENESPVVFLAVHPWLLSPFQVSLTLSLSLWISRIDMLSSLSLFFSLFLSNNHTHTTYIRACTTYIRAATKFCPIIRRITCPRLASCQRYPDPLRPSRLSELCSLSNFEFCSNSKKHAAKRADQTDQKADEFLSANDGRLDDLQQQLSQLVHASRDICL